MSSPPDWLKPELLTGLGRFIDAQDIPPQPRLSTEEALEVIVRDWLQGQGYVALPDGDTVVPVAMASKVPNDG